MASDSAEESQFILTVANVKALEDALEYLKFEGIFSAAPLNYYDGYISQYSRALEIIYSKDESTLVKWERICIILRRSDDQHKQPGIPRGPERNRHIRIAYWESES
ncbi:hypothetical protein F4778DRAFT_711801 [Xylariomycetidae sp. FL2044]|nr:hypothetical protein F4778DRAFT_711801 [Xylariomycetidae sp. FL2044]